MKKLLAVATLSSLASFASAETYNFFGGLGVTDTDADGSDPVIEVGGLYYFEGQDTVGPLDQFAYLEDTSQVAAAIENTEFSDTYMVRGAYYGGMFGVGLQYVNVDTDFGSADAFRVHGDVFFTENFKAIVGYTMPDEGDDVLDLALQYDHSINDTDYIGFTLGYVDTEESVVSLSTKYLNAFDNGQFLVLEAEFADADDTSFAAEAKWYLNKNTGFLLGGNDDDYTYIGATHFFTPNFAIDATVGQIDAAESITQYGLEAVLQF